jgi:phosphate transport system substrate-binding protein
MTKLAKKALGMTMASALVVAGVVMAKAEMTINGAGASFPYPIYSKWFDEYHKTNPEVKINYQSIGSGGGIRQITARTVDFGATDGPMDDKKLFKADGKRSGGLSQMRDGA